MGRQRPSPLVINGYVVVFITLCVLLKGFVRVNVIQRTTTSTSHNNACKSLTYVLNDPYAHLPSARNTEHDSTISNAKNTRVSEANDTKLKQIYQLN